MNELVKIEEKQALDYFLGEKGLDPVLDKIEKEIKQFVPDMSTQKGRDEIRSFAYKIRQSKTYIDGIGKNLVDELKKQPKLIDAERKRVRDKLDEWRDEVRKPLTEYEEREKERVFKIQNRIEAIKEIGETNPLLDSENLKKEKEYLLKTFPLDDSWDEFKDLAKMSLDNTNTYLDNIIDRAIEREEKEAELEKLKKEALEREAKEREERIKREAEENARREAEAEMKKKHEEEKRKIEEEKRKLEDEKKQVELALQKEKEEKERAIVEAKRKEEERIAEEKRKEQERINAEKRKKGQELAKKKEEERIEKERLANIAHRESVEKTVAESLLSSGCVSRDFCDLLVKTIANGEIPHLEIKY